MKGNGGTGIKHMANLHSTCNLHCLVLPWKDTSTQLQVALWLPLPPI